MILGSTHTKQENKETHLDFLVIGSTPTTATIIWFKNPQKPELGENSVTLSLISEPENVYSFTYLITAETFWVKLNTEAKVMEYDNLYNFKDNSDKNMYIERDSSGFLTKFWIPICDAGKINVELSTVDGSPLEAWTGDPHARFWSKSGTGIYNHYGKPKLLNLFTISGIQVREKGSTYQNISYIDKFYIRVTGLENVILNDIVNATIIDDEDYSFSWGEMASKIQP